MPKAYIFDMDGVIVNSEPFHIKAELEVLHKHGYNPLPEELEKYTGTTPEFMFRDMIARHNLDTTVDEIEDEKDKLLLSLLEKHVEPIPGVIDLIKRLKTDGYKLAVASSSHRNFINFVLTTLEIKDVFDEIVSGQDVENGKPAPDIFLLAAEKLGATPNECIVIEDATHGIAAANAAGMTSIGYDTGRQDLSKANRVVMDMADVC